VSSAIYGSINNMNLLLQTHKYWYDLLDSHEAGFGDVGFKGALDHDICIFTPQNPHSSIQY